MSTDEEDTEDVASPRRDFLGKAIAGTAATLGVLVAYPVGRFLQPTDAGSTRAAVLGRVDEFPYGAVRTVMLGNRPALVIRLADGSFRAFVALCTHLGCVVGYSEVRKQIECGCHRGVFSVEGKNIAGPPPRPLEALQVTVIEDVVTVREG